MSHKNDAAPATTAKAAETSERSFDGWDSALPQFKPDSAAEEAEKKRSLQLYKMTNTHPAPHWTGNHGTLETLHKAFVR